MKKKLLLVISIAALFATVLLSGPEKLVSAVANFRSDLILPILFLSLANYAVRFARWDYLLDLAAVKISRGRNALVFLSSFLFSISPAKSGDLVKAYYLKHEGGTKYAVSVPVIFLERVFDVLGILLLLSVSGALYFSGYAYIFVALAAIVIFATIFLKDIMGLFVNRFNMPFFQKSLADVKSALASSKAIFSRKSSFVCLVLGTVAWFFECAGLYLVVLGFGVSPDAVRETLIYSASTFGGAISMLPGGLGATEGGMAALLAKFAGASFSVALSMTIVIRAFTLWFAVALGFLATVLIARTGQQKK